ncbi:hypothetical protein JCGZ_25485 [Jatropha curcas]|uniref:Uncharacterized protein n=1 Tax=Jatropha curcas TaxID=180498 RepID=A0A067JL97_JATCU|nr:hypothetical protein JCGZ_25485 [Jatropha curcas]
MESSENRVEDATRFPDQTKSWVPCNSCVRQRRKERDRERERERPELLQRGGDEKEAVAEALVSCRCCVRHNEKGKRGEEAGAAVRRRRGKDARRGGAGSGGRKTREERQRGRAKEEEEKEKRNKKGGF